MMKKGLLAVKFFLFFTVVNCVTFETPRLSAGKNSRRNQVSILNFNLNFEFLKIFTKFFLSRYFYLEFFLNLKSFFIKNFSHIFYIKLSYFI